ncbi:metal dependent phosphohydrolase [Malonomonas rubra DSM 5091]|uniref:Metal dependent phosphohydrolase n=1 Tax=Malonomonas rubra DSM 5091 TaxID=1122189 RepID=A0A1M6G4I1_MALRU|nr:HD domain-containing phosphohydrolase [Malonomonas rubra]SHJ04717.1 metal dependent phosphohydrolase [Malonomonas rubra DSM 5091]
MTATTFIEDYFSNLHNGGRLQDRLSAAHQMFNRQCPGIARVGIALFDGATRKVKTFLASPADSNPLKNYQHPLDDAESLASTAVPGQVRIVNDLGVFSSGTREHTLKINDLGMRSSYTLPIFEQEHLRGFVFLNSQQKDFFQGKAVLGQVPLFAHCLVQMVLEHQGTLRTLISALRVSSRMMHYKDPETSNHLERMAAFSQLIAQEMIAQQKLALDDEEVEHIYRFAPLHDIGKVGIPDKILQKAGDLDSSEWSVMKTHSGIGRAIVDQLISEFGFANLPDIDILRHITELHHEKIDGSGYPHGYSGDQVPFAARIVSVSDIFDALTSSRPYKQAWSNQRALDELEQMVQRNQLDADCVAALQSRLDSVEQIQKLFADS